MSTASALERVLVGMPLYDGKPEWETSKGWSSMEANPKLIPGIELLPAKLRYFSAGSARNMMIAQAKAHGCRRLLFIDHDMAFNERHIRRILSHDLPIVGGLYPKRDLAMLRWASIFDKTKIEANGVAPAFNIGAAFLAVRLDAIEVIEKAHPELNYVCTHAALLGKVVSMLFREQIVVNDWENPGKPPWPCLLSEDLYFCHIARQAGIPIFVDTQCQIGHIGAVDFLELHRVRQAERVTSG